MDSYIKIDGWRTNIRFSSAHVIPEYEKCGRIHGHTYAIHLKIEGIKDEKGIIIDFSIIKSILKEIANDLDHHILIPGKSDSIEIHENKKQIILHSLKKEYILPKEDCRILPISSTSAENLSSYILEEITKKIDLNANISSIEVGVDEGYGQGAFVLKKF
jgi:6-pyruvoyltetrahydropterin/6-carboxytetrahydropterin synthase